MEEMNRLALEQSHTHMAHLILSISQIFLLKQTASFFFYVVRFSRLTIWRSRMEKKIHSFRINTLGGVRLSSYDHFKHTVVTVNAVYFLIYERSKKKIVGYTVKVCNPILLSLCVLFSFCFCWFSLLEQFFSSSLSSLPLSLAVSCSPCVSCSMALFFSLSLSCYNSQVQTHKTFCAKNGTTTTITTTITKNTN